MNDQVNEEQTYEQSTETPLEQLGEHQEEPTQEAVEQTGPSYHELSEQKNFKELREARDRATFERDDALRRLQEYEARSSNRQAAAHEDEDDLSIDDDALVEGKTLKTTNKKIKQLEKTLQQVTNTAIENSLRAKFSDFDEIITQENVSRLNDQYPEIASVIRSSPDLYSKSVAAYNFIKNNGLAAQKNYDQDRDMAQRNANKPRPLISTKNSSPMAHVNEFASGILTEEYKDKLYRQALEHASR